MYSTSTVLRLYSSDSAYAWIGLNDIVTETVFQWIDGSPATWFDWAALNPQGRLGEDCVVVDINWQFTDSFCTGSEFFDPAVCEGKPGKCFDLRRDVIKCSNLS